MTFTLHPQLEKDCVVVGDLKLCRVLLMNNRRFPWLILVPMTDNPLEEITDLTAKERTVLMQEIAFVSRKLQTHTDAYKMNVAALGNMVRQLHVHVIARFEGDDAWPNPVWGQGGEAYEPKDLKQCVKMVKDLLGVRAVTA